jgi:hypothetical protein
MKCPGRVATPAFSEELIYSVFLSMRLSVLRSQPLRLSQGSGRLQLANWIASPQNPLTSRVIANRVWHWLFGNGLRTR